jgi:chemosensory pili system protein ChpC
VAEDIDELASVVIPTPGASLLLPNVCVAEIVPWRRIKPLDDGPTWCMGFVGWRGQVLTVVNFASLNDPNVPPPTAARCLVVMNRSRTNQGPAFYALAAQGLPRMLQLLEDDVINADEPLGIADVMKVELGTEVVTIPNLAFVEQELASIIAEL